MGRHRRNKPGQGAYQYKERRLYYGICQTHGTRYQSFHKGKIWVKACAKCRREAAKISPGQEMLFVGVDPAQEGADKTVTMIKKHDRLVMAVTAAPDEMIKPTTKGGEKQA